MNPLQRKLLDVFSSSMSLILAFTFLWKEQQLKQAHEFHYIKSCGLTHSAEIMFPGVSETSSTRCGNNMATFCSPLFTSSFHSTVSVLPINPAASPSVHFLSAPFALPLSRESSLWLLLWFNLHFHQNIFRPSVHPHPINIPNWFSWHPKSCSLLILREFTLHGSTVNC